MRSRAVRRAALRPVSARPGDVPEEVAVSTARVAAASRHFPQHFRQTRVLRFTGGRAIPPEVPVKVVWGASDTIARARTSRHTDQLPPHAIVETWERCGHMVMWDRRDDVVRAALTLP